MQRSLLLIEEAERADGTPVILLLGKDGDPQRLTSRSSSCRHMWIHGAKWVLRLSLSLSLSLPVFLSPVFFCFYSPSLSLLGGSGAFPPFTLMILNETLSCDFDLV